MNLAGLRKVAIKKNLRIRFTLANGLECVVNEHGIAQVPALHAPPAFNLEDELTRAQTFLVEPAAGTGKEKSMKPRRLTRDEMAALATAGPGEAAHDEHEE